MTDNMPQETPADLIRKASNGKSVKVPPTTITPEMAKSYLSLGCEEWIDPDDIDEDWIATIEQEMRDGKFPGAIITLSENYKICDDDHRHILMAIARCGVPVGNMILFNIPELRPQLES